MPKNTRLPGHTLKAEGKPFVWSQYSRRYVRALVVYSREVKEGCGMCSCDEVSQTLHSDAERKRWHAIHKQRIRELADAQIKEG
jgi:hypothetical protein